MSRILKYHLLISTMLIFLACVKIETGQTLDEAIESNEFRAKEMRVEWRQTLDRTAGDKARALIVKERIDSTSALIIRYGYKVADEWRKGNEGRGVPIESAEMRQVVNAWVATQKPYLLAYEDNIEYGIGLVKETRLHAGFPEEVYALFDSLALHYYSTYSAVFYPNNEVDTYEEMLRSSDSRHQDMSGRLERLIR